MGEIRRIVSQVLSQLGTNREARYYLQRYSAERRNFAVVEVGGAMLGDAIDELAQALAFLANLGLMPVVLHEAGEELGRALSEAGIELAQRDGRRVVTPEAMAVARPVIYRVNRRLVAALEEQGARAQGIQHGVFVCEYLDRDRFGLAGAIQRVELEALRDAVDRGALPVVACLGESETGQVLDIGMDHGIRELAREVEPHKVIFLTEGGGWRDGSGRLISAINLRTDYDWMRSEAWVDTDMRHDLDEIRALLMELPESASVSITGVGNLARELFTHRGAGTLIRRGEAIVEHDSFTSALQVDTVRLLRDSFGRTVRPDYFADLPVACILRTESGGAMAIVLHGVDGVPYLDKFAVTPEAQGAGLGAAVWKALVHRLGRLYWRARIGNPVTPWYFTQADASFTRDGWVAFSIGITDFDQLRRCQEDGLARPSSWVEDGDV